MDGEKHYFIITNEFLPIHTYEIDTKDILSDWVTSQDIKLRIQNHVKAPA